MCVTEGYVRGVTHLDRLHCKLSLVVDYDNYNNISTKYMLCEG